jgi:hypothetical protein
MASLFKKVEDRDLDRSRTVPYTPMTELRAEDYSWEALRIASENWNRPVVVRGLFKNTTGVQSWTPEYLADSFGSAGATVMAFNRIDWNDDKACNKTTKSRDIPFSTIKPFNETILAVASGKDISFVMPPASRSKWNHDLNAYYKFKKVAFNDLDLKRAGGIFANATEELKMLTYIQMFAAWDSNEEGVETGTAWHADICNNYIIMVKGKKRWEFLDSKYSKYIRPVHPGGVSAIVVSHESAQKETLPYVPKTEVILEEGDFVYNPEWEWHKVINYPGLSMGIVSRECIPKRNMDRSSLFTSMFIAHHLLAAPFDDRAAARVKSLFFGTEPK